MATSLETTIHDNAWLESQAVVKNLGIQEYEPVWKSMQSFTSNRDANTPDEIWVVEHPAVFTLGQAAKPEHVLDIGDIPLVQTDRGGQVTYHGPGQVVIYPLLDLRRKKLGVKSLVWLIEQAVIDTLNDVGLDATRRDGAPGIYMAATPDDSLGGAKISALGLRVRQMRSYHGLSLNVDMDLDVFSRINPCGYAGMPVTDIRTEMVKINKANQSPESINALNISKRLINSLCTLLKVSVIID